MTDGHQIANFDLTDPEVLANKIIASLIYYVLGPLAQ